MKKLMLAIVMFPFLCVEKGNCQNSTHVYADSVVSNRRIETTGVQSLTDVIITHDGSLTVYAQDGVEIDSYFEVEQGGVFYVGRRYRVSYTYDSSGNRIQRKED